MSVEGSIINSLLTCHVVHEGLEDAQELRHHGERCDIEHRLTQLAAAIKNVTCAASHTLETIPEGTWEKFSDTVSSSMNICSRTIPLIGSGIATALDSVGLAKCEYQINKVQEKRKETLSGTRQAQFLASKEKALAKQSANYGLGLAVDGLHIASTFVDLGIVSGIVAGGVAAIRLVGTRHTINTYKDELKDMIKSYEEHYAEKGLDPKEELWRVTEELTAFLKDCEGLNDFCEQALLQLQSLEDEASNLDPQTDKSNIENEIQKTKNGLQKLIQTFRRKTAELPARRYKFLMIAQNYEGIKEAKNTLIDLNEDLQRYQKHSQRKQAHEKANPDLQKHGGLAVLEMRHRKNLKHVDKAKRLEAQSHLKNLEAYRKSCCKLDKLHKEIVEKLDSLKKEAADLQAKKKEIQLSIPDLAQKGVAKKRAELKALIQNKKGNNDEQSKRTVKTAEESLKDVTKYKKASEELEKVQRKIDLITHVIKKPVKEKRGAHKQQLMKDEMAQLEDEISRLRQESANICNQIKQSGSEHVFVDDIVIDDEFVDDVLEPKAFIIEDAPVMAKKDNVTAPQQAPHSPVSHVKITQSEEEIVNKLGEMESALRGYDILREERYAQLGENGPILQDPDQVEAQPKLHVAQTPTPKTPLTITVTPENSDQVEAQSEKEESPSSTELSKQDRELLDSLSLPPQTIPRILSDQDMETLTPPTPVSRSNSNREIAVTLAAN